ncbi:hypothetical protein [Ruegeria sp. HKCCA4812]|uniref:hypothetical protein n=1 Tax=Ruegeria sp. HKCCA4812 TaxID=2682993 RepID=UPI001489C8F2|nr:hypothetical protein [Ruegeria sp. HKCCA4812]
MPSEFEEMRDRVQAVFGAFDETVLIVLKGHLLIEEMLDSIIRTFVFHPDYLDDARLSFTQKLHIARSISLDEHDNAMWEIAIRINRLRNELAHSLDSPKRAGRIQSVLDAYFAEANEDEHIALVKDQEEPVKLAFAASYFIGFLGSFKAEINRFREVIDGIDQVMNPHRHQG